MIGFREEYVLGERKKIVGKFTANGEPADPTEVRFQIRKRTNKNPDEYIYVEPSTMVHREDIGVYYVVWDWTEPGIWYYRFVGSGAVATSGETEVVVPASPTLNVTHYV